MRVYRDPDTGQFISKERWEEIQRDLEREREADDYDDYEDYEEYGDLEEYGEDA